MILLAPHVLLLIVVLFNTTVLLHLVRKNSTAIGLYVVQSLAVALLLLVSLIDHATTLAIVALIATLVAKVVLAPLFLGRLVRANRLRFSASSYLNLPVTLLVLALLVGVTFSRFVIPLAALAPENPTAMLITVASFFSALFLLVNRKGAISQMLGILSIENCIVAFGLLTNLEQNPALELGITFDILVWISIATIFVGMVYRQFGTLDVTLMKNLSETTI